MNQTQSTHRSQQDDAVMLKNWHLELEELFPGIVLKSYYKTSEVLSALQIKAYLLRFWETEFDGISPMIGEGGQNLYHPTDLRVLWRIKNLLLDCEYSVEKAKALLDLELKKVMATGSEVIADLDYTSEKNNIHLELPEVSTESDVSPFLIPMNAQDFEVKEVFMTSEVAQNGDIHDVPQISADLAADQMLDQVLQAIESIDEVASIKPVHNVAEFSILEGVILENLEHDHLENVMFANASTYIASIHEPDYSERPGNDRSRSQVVMWHQEELNNTQAESGHSSDLAFFHQMALETFDASPLPEFLAATHHTSVNSSESSLEEAFASVKQIDFSVAELKHWKVELLSLIQDLKNDFQQW